MFTSEDYEWFYLRYTAEALPHGESIQAFCLKNNIPYNLLGYTPQSSSHSDRWCSSDAGGTIPNRDHHRSFGTTGSQNHDQYTHDQWSAHITPGNELQSTQGTDCKSGDVMLRCIRSLTGRSISAKSEKLHPR